MSPDGCAVHPDGTLKDASEIEWFNDKDDDAPLTSDSQPVSRAAVPFSDSSNSSTPNPQVTHPFFSGQRQPAILVAGSRWSTRTTRPSRRLLDNDEAATASKGPGSPHSGIKRKASSETRSNTRRVSRKIVVESDAEDSE